MVSRNRREAETKILTQPSQLVPVTPLGLEGALFFDSQVQEMGQSCWTPRVMQTLVISSFLTTQAVLPSCWLDPDLLTGSLALQIHL